MFNFSFAIVKVTIFMKINNTRHSNYYCINKNNNLYKYTSSIIISDDQENNFFF